MTTDLAALQLTLDPARTPPTWRTWNRFMRVQRVLLGRQGIFSARGDVLGYELFFRSPHGAPLHVDDWTAPQQDRATAHVIHATFAGPGVSSVAHDRQVFVNFTRSYLVGDLQVPCHPEQLVVEIVESVVADNAVLAGVRRLRERGFRIAIDDFVGLASQRRLLPYADYVKIDVRDLDVEGQPLLDLARSHGAQLVAECVETELMLDECQTAGFELFQGNALGVTTVLDRTDIVPSQRGG